MTFPLSDQPVLGEWFIFVEMQGHVYNKSFEVQKYGKLENLNNLRISHLGKTTDPVTSPVMGEHGSSPMGWDSGQRAGHFVISLLEELS